MIIIMSILIHLLLGVMGYFLIRKAYKNEFNSWTVSDRNVHLLIIILGVTALMFGLFIYIDSIPDNNYESKL